VELHLFGVSPYALRQGMDHASIENVAHYLPEDGSLLLEEHNNLDWPGSSLTLMRQLRAERLAAMFATSPVESAHALDP
jgi:hypothetical protein